jgi:vacuolar-type H+-ATPase subunit H
MAQHEAPKPSTSDAILREIAQKERELQEELTRAQQEAAQLVEDAQREADAIRARAREQAQQEEASSASASAAEVQAITEQVLAKARTEAAALRQRAEERMSAAVALVVGEVLGERA